MRLRFLLFCSIYLFSSLSWAEPSSFFNRKAEGWFWYQKAPETLQPPDKKKPKPKAVDPVVIIKAPSKPTEKVKEPGPAPMTSAWLQKNLPKYLETAQDDPSQQNITAYLYLQRLAVDKAQRFADGAQAAIIADPLLDESTRRPLSTFGAKNATAEGQHYTNQILTDLGQKIGIWLFFRSDCPYSDSQAAVQRLLERDYGLRTFAISLDGKGLPSGTYPDFVADQGQSKNLKVVQTPALFLANPETNEIIPLGQGNLAKDELKKRILVASAAVNWLSPEDFSRTRPANGPVLDPRTLENLTEEEAQDPKKVIDVLRARLSKSKGY